MIRKTLEFIEQNSTIISLIASCFTGIIGFFANKGLERIKKERLAHALRLKKDKDFNITMRIYDNVQLVHYEHGNDVNATSDVLAAMNVYKFLQMNGLSDKRRCYINKSRLDNTNEIDNIFCIGGFIANKQTAYYFKEFFPGFRVYTRRIYENRMPPSDKYIFNDTKKGFCWGNGNDKEYLVDKDEQYAILVRLTEEDFDIENAGTVYILYGNNAMSTLGLSEYILNHVEDLIKKTRRRKHFFIVFKVNEIDGKPSPDMRGFKDLTDEIFPK